LVTLADRSPSVTASFSHTDPSFFPLLAVFAFHLHPPPISAVAFGAPQISAVAFVVASNDDGIHVLHGFDDAARQDEPVASQAQVARAESSLEEASGKSREEPFAEKRRLPGRCGAAAKSFLPPPPPTMKRTPNTSRRRPPESISLRWGLMSRHSVRTRQSDVQHRFRLMTPPKRCLFGRATQSSHEGTRRQHPPTVRPTGSLAVLLLSLLPQTLAAAERGSYPPGGPFPQQSGNRTLAYNDHDATTKRPDGCSNSFCTQGTSLARSLDRRRLRRALLASHVCLVVSCSLTWTPKSKRVEPTSSPQQRDGERSDVGVLTRGCSRAR
jgi:hypothetical protein